MIGEHAFSYCEVLPDQAANALWKEISLNTGGTQSTLQDIKIAEKANGYCYKDSSRYLTRNRFIYWRINNDVLELVEQSLDLNLSGNKLRYKFVDTPILDGITIHETHSNVVVLVPTVCSVHRLVFPHPDGLHKQYDLLESHPDLSVPSIFSESSQTRDSSFYVYVGPSTANSQLPHAAASWLTMDEEAIFLLAYPSGELILVTQSADGDGRTTDLKYESIVPKFFSGMFMARSNENNVIVSMILHTLRLETYAITLCRDGQLRVWSCSKAQCIAVSDILSESIRGRQLEQGAQNHMLRKGVGCDETNFIFGVYLSFSYDSHIDILKPVLNGPQFVLVKMYSSIYSPMGDIIDFSLTPSRVWSAFRGKDGEWNCYTATLNPENDRSTRWMPVQLESLPDPDKLPVDESLDPKQAYLQYIFHPGRFPLHVIGKALSIYKRSLVMSDINMSASLLKQRVCLAVENEIQAQVQECEVDDEDYLEAANWCWSRFYSCCVQYHVVGLRPLGILLLPSVSGAVLLKKSTYSFLRPLDVLEHLVLCSEHVTVDALYGNAQLSSTKKECGDIIVLTGCLVHLEEHVDDGFKAAFERELALSVPPGKAMSELLTDVEADKTFVQTSNTIKSQLRQCGDLYATIHKLLELLRMDQPLPENDEFPQELKSSVMHFFSSQLGVSLVSQSFAQQIRIKYSICRNLLLLQYIIQSEDSGDSILESIRTVCTPEVSVLLQSYYALKWLTDLTAAPIMSLEAQSHRLSSLKLAPVFNLKPNVQQVYSLIELYAGSNGGNDAHRALLKYDFDEDSLAHWHTALLPYLTQFALIIWPINGNAAFTEWMLSSGQHLHLQQYVRLIDSWCDWNHLTRSFLLAVSFLNSGEVQKAYDLFLAASKGVDLERFIVDLVGNARGTKAVVLYYLKVIQLLELHGCRDLAIEAADCALASVIDDSQEPLKMTLYSTKFKHHLSLGHYEDAFDALMTNPDKDRQRDNLRDLVKTLLDNRSVDILLSFSYGELESLFIDILYSRARACDTVTNIYYDLMYSYAINRSFMRLAGSVVYEQAFRLQQHNTLEALEKQVKCYLCVVNCLSLTEKRFAWVLRPVDADIEDEEVELPINLALDMDEPEIISYKRVGEVVELKEIRKELLFYKARLQLARMEPDSISANISSVHELVVFLASAGIFRMALQLCQAYEMGYETVFELLTHQCVALSMQESNDSWNWLIENNLSDLDFVGNTPSTVAWTLLQTYLLEYEPDNLSVYHRVIVEKILAMDYFVPHWLEASYKKRNPGELLFLYFSHGHLHDAYTLAMDHLKAALGYGPEYFGLKECLTPSARPLCLPVHIIEALMYEFKLQNEDDLSGPFKKEYETLSDLFHKYVETSLRISYDVCREKTNCMF